MEAALQEAGLREMGRPGKGVLEGSLWEERGGAREPSKTQSYEIWILCKQWGMARPDKREARLLEGRPFFSFFLVFCFLC